MKNTKDEISQAFLTKFGKQECIVFSPGRANIIGEHTDYNDGFVLPFAIEQGIFFIARVNESNVINIFSHDLNQDAKINLNQLDNETDSLHWSRYFIQVLIRFPHKISFGLDIVFGGNLPFGAGVSSSSAITCGFISVLNTLYVSSLSKLECVKLAVESEHGIGVRGGMMDQYAIYFGKQDTAILIDCLKNSHNEINIKLKNHHFYLINTMVKHNLVLTDYNTRRNECDQALKIFNTHDSNINSFRDIDLNLYEKHKHHFSETLKKRVKHILTENLRVHQVVKMISELNFIALGEILIESHKSLSNDFEVSCFELDELIDICSRLETWLGGRMMGGGFGGCTINIFDKILSASDKTFIKKNYQKKYNLIPDIIPIKPSNGLMILNH